MYKHNYVRGGVTAILMMSRGGLLQGSVLVEGISEADWKQ